MKEETRELIKENLVKMNSKVHKAASEFNRDWLKEKLLKAYHASPPKIQYVLAKYVMKAVINNKKPEKKELIRH